MRRATARSENYKLVYSEPFNRGVFTDRWIDSNSSGRYYLSGNAIYSSAPYNWGSPWPWLALRTTPDYLYNAKLPVRIEATMFLNGTATYLDHRIHIYNSWIDHYVQLAYNSSYSNFQGSSIGISYGNGTYNIAVELYNGIQRLYVNGSLVATRWANLGHPGIEFALEGKMDGGWTNINVYEIR